MARPINAVASDTYYVALHGNNSWSGLHAEPTADGKDGPFASLTHAREVIRSLLAEGKLGRPVTVFLRDGRYPVDQPIVFTAADSGPVTYSSYPGEAAVLDGGIKISGWEEATVNGVKAWEADLPEVAAGTWYFRSLYVNGERRERPRLPKEGLYRIKDVPGMPIPAGWGQGNYSQFRLGDGQMKQWKNITDVEIVAYHFWIDERFPVASFDAETELITSARPSHAPLVEAHGKELAPCFIENVFEALSEPGEWYLDRSEGKLYYIPLPGETLANTDVVAPRCLQILKVKGVPSENRWVEWLRFENLGFEHTDWVQPGPDVEHLLAPAFTDSSRQQHVRYRQNRASACQGAADVPGAVYLEGARHCSVMNCRIANIGWYGLQLADGCVGNHIMHNEITDLGAGGIIVDGAAWDEPVRLRTGNNLLTDNHIHKCGRVFHSGIGVLAMHTFGNTISHNHIHDLYYSGISCGWMWGYRPQIARDNIIAKNHIHDLGHGLLSDMGGIYTLGVQPGTVIRGNLIHDVVKLNYGAWCIYPDEGSSHLVIEKNVCLNTNGEIFHQHYGRENIVRNNLFAFGGDSILAHGRLVAEHKSFTLEKNIFLTDGKPIFKAGYGVDLEARNHRSDQNLLWDVSEESLTFHGAGGKVLSLQSWQQLGHDVHSVVADPKCADPKNGDFTLAADSPAFDLGFEPIDLSDVGPRPRGRG